MDNNHAEFHTLKGYQMQNIGEITESMEDYLEMITRYIQENGYIRMNFLAGKLNVRPSSASKMVGKLKDMQLVMFEKYGLSTLTDKGMVIGNYLLWRHDVLHRFFCFLNHSECELDQVEMVEHYMTRRTVENIDQLMTSLTSKKPLPDTE